jgi:hypothetical protein
MALSRTFRKTANASRVLRGVTAVAGIAALGLTVALSTANASQAATRTSLSATALSATAGTQFGTLDTQPASIAAETGSPVSGAMLEFNWASFEPTKGTLSASYLATMKSYLHAYQAAGMKVTLGLGLQNPPSWVSSLPNKAKVVAYVSSVADQSGNDDSCQSSDITTPLTSNTMDSWSATRWISRIAHQQALLIGGENPGYGIPASLNAHYLDSSSTGMMADALRQSQSCGFQVFYWAHDIHLWDGTIPFARYATAIAPYATAPANLALAGTLTASSALSGFVASTANDANQGSYWQAAGGTATVTLRLAQAGPVARIILELPQGWGTRTQTVQVDGSANGSTWTTLAAPAAYQFTAGSNAIAIPVPVATQGYLRLDISGNNVQGAPQVSEFQAYSG